MLTGNRAVLGAFPTTRALDRVYITRMAGQSDLEISRLSFNVFHFTVCDDVYVQVPADLDQFR